MQLHRNCELFEDLIKLTSESLNIPDIFIEKDYWVTYILKNISESEFRNSVVFKGGTSLSKAYHLISRFSEDIDLALLCNGELSDGQRKKKLKDVECTATAGLTNAEQQAVQSGREAGSKGSKYRKTWWEYERLALDGNFGQAHPYLLLEINSFADPNPHSLLQLQSYIGAFLQTHNDQSTINNFGLTPFEINVLSTKRTMAEKIMGLVRASHQCTNNDASKLAQKIRHIYDIFYLTTKDNTVKAWLTSDEFFTTLSAAHENDKSVHNKSAEWCYTSLAEHSIFSSFSHIWTQLEPVWNGTFKVLVYEELPSKEDLTECFATLGQRLSAYDRWLKGRKI